MEFIIFNIKHKIVKLGAAKLLYKHAEVGYEDARV